MRPSQGRRRGFESRRPLFFFKFFASHSHMYAKHVCYICGLLFGLLCKPPALRLSMAHSSPRLPLRVPSSAPKRAEVFPTAFFGVDARDKRPVWGRATCEQSAQRFAIYSKREGTFIANRSRQSRRPLFFCKTNQYYI